jgi:hypothetical protein
VPAAAAYTNATRQEIPAEKQCECEIIAGQPQMRDPSAQGLQPGVGGYRYSTNRDVYVIRNAQGTKIGTIK